MKNKNRQKLEEIFFANSSSEERLSYEKKKAEKKAEILKNLPPEVIQGPPGPAGPPGKGGSPDTAEKIVEKINSLPLEGKKIDFSHIGNFPWHIVKKLFPGGTNDGVGFMGYGAYSLNLKSITLGQITANQNNYTTGLGAWFRISSDAARDITGFDSGTDGRGYVLTNVGSFTITLKNQSASSQPTNRILTATGSDIALTANASAWVIYDVVSGRWRAVLTSVGGGSSNNFTYNEVVAGNTNTFTLAAAPLANTQCVYANGQRLTPTVDYTIAGAIITTVLSWSAGSILADYQT